MVQADVPGYEMSDQDELEDEAEDTGEADHHPDVKIGDIAHIRGGLSHPGVHGDQGEQRGHADTNSGCYLQRDVTEEETRKTFFSIIFIEGHSAML